MAKRINTTMTTDLIERRIHVVRGFRSMLDEDLAALYGVPTKVLNQAVQRNTETAQIRTIDSATGWSVPAESSTVRRARCKA